MSIYSNLLCETSFGMGTDEGRVRSLGGTFLYFLAFKRLLV